MDNLLEDIAAEKERITSTLKELHKTQQREKREFAELAAIATCLHNTYSGVENLLKRTLKFMQVPLPDSKTSHKDLLALAVEQKIISQELSNNLAEYLAFRHFFVNGYGILLQEAPLQPLAENLPETWSRFETELDTFVTKLK